MQLRLLHYFEDIIVDLGRVVEIINDVFFIHAHEDKTKMLKCEIKFNAEFFAAVIL